MLDFHVFAMTLLRYKRGTSTDQFALLLGSSGGFIACARSTLSSRPVTGTAIINLIQSALDQNIDLKQAWIYSTDVPTEACMGMARLQTRGGYIICNSTTAGKTIGFHADRQAPKWEASPIWSPHGALAWSQLAPGADLNAWHAAIKAKRLGEPKIGVLKDEAALAAAAVETLAIQTGRTAATLAPFFAPEDRGRLEIVQQLATQAERDNFFSLLAQELVYRLRGRQTEGSGTKGHNIGCLVVDHNGRIVAWGVNTNATNGTFHAETNAVQALESDGARLPKGGVMYTSLEPCEMCSGIIRNALADGDRGFRILFIQTDATLHSTVLKGITSPVVMVRSPVTNDVAAANFPASSNYGEQLAQRQAALDHAEAERTKRLTGRPNHKFLAPTAFVREKTATDVFMQAQAQRRRVSAPPLPGAAAAASRAIGNRFAADEQAVHRGNMDRLLAMSPADAQLQRLGTRDDIAAIQTGTRSVQERIVLQSRMNQAVMQGLRPGAAPIRALDDSVIGQRRHQIVDPGLVQMRIQLDKLSVRFRAVLDQWILQKHGPQTAIESARIVRQVDDFLSAAERACPK